MDRTEPKVKPKPDPETSLKNLYIAQDPRFFPQGQKAGLKVVGKKS